MVTTSKNGCVENMAENVPTECTDTAVRLQHVQPQKPSQYQPSTFKHSFVSRVIKSPYSQKLHSQPIRLELARSRKYFLILSANGLQEIGWLNSFKKALLKGSSQIKSALSVWYVAVTRLSLPCEHKAVTLCSPYKCPSSKLSVHFPSSEPTPAPCSPFFLSLTFCSDPHSANILT